MRESPLPAWAGEAGAFDVDGRVVVAIAKCMALCGLRPDRVDSSSLSCASTAARVRESEKVADGRKGNAADRTEGSDKNEKRKSAQQRAASVISGYHERNAQAKSVKRTSIQTLTLLTPGAECQSDDAPRDQAVGSKRQVILSADANDDAHNSRDDEFSRQATRHRTDAGGGRSVCR